MGGIHKHIFEHVYLDVSETEAYLKMANWMKQG
jgi:hypothetical protein